MNNGSDNNYNNNDNVSKNINHSCSICKDILISNQTYPAYACNQCDDDNNNVLYFCHRCSLAINIYSMLHNVTFALFMETLIRYSSHPNLNQILKQVMLRLFVI